MNETVLLKSESIEHLIHLAELEYKLMVDMDGVLADFNKKFESYGKGSPDSFVAKHGEEAMWYFLNNKIPISF
jgi:phospholipase C